MNKQIDYVAQIMQQWYDAMDKEKVGVQPKCVQVVERAYIPSSFRTIQTPYFSFHFKSTAPRV